MQVERDAILRRTQLVLAVYMATWGFVDKRGS